MPHFSTPWDSIHVQNPVFTILYNVFSRTACHLQLFFPSLKSTFPCFRRVGQFFLSSLLGILFAWFFASYAKCFPAPADFYRNSTRVILISDILQHPCTFNISLVISSVTLDTVLMVNKVMMRCAPSNHSQRHQSLLQTRADPSQLS